MAKSSTETDLYGTSFSIESMKVIAESIGIGNLPDDAAKELADDVSFRLKHVIQDAIKFMHHSKRTKLMPCDIDCALKVKNLEVSLLLHRSELTSNKFGCSHNMGFILRKLCLFVLLLVGVVNCTL